MSKTNQKRNHETQSPEVKLMFFLNIFFQNVNINVNNGLF